MHIKMTKTYDHRFSSARSRRFLKGTEYKDVPKTVAESAIEAGCATQVSSTTSSSGGSTSSTTTSTET